MNNAIKRSVYAVDFDGTLCENEYPRIGKPKKRVIEFVKKQKKLGNYLILWTCREGQSLQEAIEWCKLQGITFHAHNENIKHRIMEYKTDPRKVGADYYIDDRAIKPGWFMR